jgi:hypothetical protein
MATQMTAITWAINPVTGNYDIFNSFTDSGNAGNLEVIQSKILITLGTFQGEWAPLPDFGIPFTTINANSDNPDVLSQIIVNEILTVQNVNSVSVNSLSYLPTTRKFSGSFNVNTVFGTTTVQIGQ